MASYVQLGEVRTYYEEDGSGAPLVLLHPGGADSRAFEVNLPGLVDRFRVFRPDRRGHGRTPDVDGPIDLDDETTAFFTEYHGAVSPDGPEHFPVIAAKLHRMHSEEPTLTVADLAGYPGPTLVMVGDDDDEIPMEHTLALRQGLPRAQLAVVPGTSHGLLADKPELCNRLIVEFLTEGTGGGDR
ncbi:MAG TPA: alpha/beta hydrolase [Actinomycetes bacterium]|nr:alpha/beta hydrolase [Actinomycetes bacterium]